MKRRPRHIIFACVIAFVSGLANGGASAAPEAEVRETFIDMASCAKPVYPKAALRMYQQGTVTLEIRLAPDGMVRESRLRNSSGVPMLDAAAREVLDACKFTPAQAMGHPPEAWLPIQYVWSMDRPAPKESPPVLEPFASAPAHLHEFLLQARKADAIADPLQRCLAFPDLPGSKWAAGLAQAYCHSLHDDSITLKQVAQHLERGGFAELDALFRRDLERHFSSVEFSEIIHRDLAIFDGGDDAARLTAVWLEKAPGSPFANAARAAHLGARAAKARGGKWAQDTPRENMVRMSALADPGLNLYAKAIKLEPHLLPAYIGVMHLARIDDRSAAGETAFNGADAVDHACLYLARERMNSLAPRWGGSLRAMQAYAQSLQPFVGARPLLALSTILPAGDQADAFLAANDEVAAIAVLEAAARIAPDPDMMENLGVTRVRVEADPWQNLAYLLTAYRYSNDDFAPATARGTMMLSAGDPAWALESLQRAEALEPGSVLTAYLQGWAYSWLKQYELAESALLKALGSKEMHEEALNFLVDALLATKQLDKAELHSSAYVRTYPASARGWFKRSRVKYFQGDDKGWAEALASFLRVVDRTDPDWARTIAFAEKKIVELESLTKAGATPALR